MKKIILSIALMLTLSLTSCTAEEPQADKCAKLVLFYQQQLVQVVNDPVKAQNIVNEMNLKLAAAGCR